MGRRPAHAPLNVYLNARLVGQLRRESSGAIDIKYNKDWLAWDNAIPVSVSLPLPLREDRHIGDPVLAVFDNLLPGNDDISGFSFRNDRYPLDVIGGKFRQFFETRSEKSGEPSGF